MEADIGTMRVDDEEVHPVARADDPDAHGQAAMLLVESLIHGMVARSLISPGEAIEIITVAMDAKVEIAADIGESDDTKDRSLALLAAVRTSLAADLDQR
jgi:hypothetical protein